MNIDRRIHMSQNNMETGGDPRRWLALPVLLTGAFLPILDFNVVNLALPAIRQGLGATPSELQFVISAYAATYAIFLITGGRLGDWLGRKRMFMIGVAGFTLASILCGFAWSAGALIAGRILQGLTATAMAPQVLASIRVLFPPSEQGKALGLYGATFGLANIVGQILGGVLVSSHPLGFTWQAIFLINIPIGVIAFVGGLLFLGDSRAEHAQRLDLGGVVLLSATLGLLVYPLVEGRDSGWPPAILGMLLAFPLMLVAFVVFEWRLMKRGGAPLVDLSLFRESGFAIGIAMALVYYMLSAFYLTFSIYLQGGLNLTPLQAGLRTLPFGLGYFAASFAAAAIMRRIGPRALTLGFIIQVIGFGCVILAVQGPLAAPIGMGLAIAGIGFGIVMPSVIKAVIGGIDEHHAGLASGIVISTFQIGAALGVAIIGGIFFSVLGAGQELRSYSDAFAVALGCNVLLLAVGAALSLWLPRQRLSNIRINRPR
ncbi:MULTISPECIES: MFS transporter [unclassified Rhizobium]|uniref:MFS transporter n=1 Tax=unclassified Rhizobium TaxID=2613769 RepID=UPI00069221EA|nr:MULTISPECIES: MFS transporter [unclassified Rhizobium]MBN8954899.1 MFS transporter [Rhizobium tropici]OJY79139.1 MAG: MFS transporter [Rhizobium sp. 60-20]RKD35864.1 EmrB/QacA subfamily drug resistance transporter [Rhizobium sp. WW_1]